MSDPLCLDSLVRRSHVSIWKWMRLFGKKTLFRRRRVTAFRYPKPCFTSTYPDVRLIHQIEPKHRYVLETYLSYQRNIMVAELPCSGLERQNLRQEGADGRGMLQRAVKAAKGVERVPALWIYTIFGLNAGRSTMGNFKHVPVWTFLARRRRSGASLCWSVPDDSEGGSSR